MRPASIQMFDKLYLGSLVVGLINFVLFFDDMVAMTQGDLAEIGMGSGFMIGVFVFGISISLLLWYFISRRASKVAKWILVVLTIWGLIGIPATLALPTVQMLMSLLATALSLGSIYFLFTPDAKAWFDGDSTADPSVFE